MKKIIATIAAISVLSISSANAWQLDLDVGGIYIGIDDGSIEIDTPSGGGSGSWDTSDD